MRFLRLTALFALATGLTLLGCQTDETTGSPVDAFGSDSGGDAQPSDDTRSPDDIQSPDDTGSLEDATSRANSTIGTDTASPDIGGTDTSLTDANLTDTSLTDTGGDADSTADAADTSDSTDTEVTCLEPLAEDHDRHIVVSHPYGPGIEQLNLWEVLTLEDDGTIGQPGTTFEMGRAPWGIIEFTPDGRLGLAAQVDGTIGIFTLSADGTPTVINPGASPGIYASAIHPESNDSILVVDENWQNNGGGVYRVPIGCDGQLGTPELLVATKLARASAPMGDGAAGALFVGATEAGAEMSGDEAYIVSTDGAVLAGANAFDDNLFTLCSAAVTPSGDMAFLGENSEFSGLDNRVAAFTLGAGSIGFTTVFPILDPFALIASPFDNAVVVVSGYANAVHVLSRDDDGPFTDLGQPTYVGGKPALPAHAVLVGGHDAAPLAGLFVLSENNGVRRMRFETDGTLTDLGVTTLGDGNPAIPGAIGVQP